jgi:hypothetical protein
LGLRCILAQISQDAQCFLLPFLRGPENRRDGVQSFQFLEPWVCQQGNPGPLSPKPQVLGRQNLSLNKWDSQANSELAMAAAGGIADP